MADEEFSCIKEVTKIVYLTLPSVYNSNEITGICDVLESWKRQYVKQLGQGIVVGYKNVTLTSKRGYLKIDCPVIHCSVKATFELFYPTIGSIIKGKINRVSQDHIGCLVHDTVNVTVHRTANLSDISKFIVLDRFILFQITRINFKLKIIHVKGRITEECVTLMKEHGFFDEELGVSEDSGLTCMSPDFTSYRNNISAIPISNASKSSAMCEISTDTSSQASSSNTKKKHKKLKTNLLSSPSLVNDSLDSETNEIAPTQLQDPVKKRKRKKSNDVVPSPSLLDSIKKEDEIYFTPPKKKRKMHDHIETDLFLTGYDSANNNISSHFPSTENKPNESSVIAKDTMENLSLGVKDSSSELSESTISKKKKRKSKDKIETSPSIFSESLESEMNEIVIKLPPDSSPKKKQKKSKKDSLTSSFNLSDVSIKTEKNEVESNQPEKHKKTEDGGSKKKDKTHKKNKKDKTKKGSKKDKKKSKNKVISTKKKAKSYKGKLKKKGKHKDKKSKKNKEK